MFRFDGVEVGTPVHKELFRKLTDLLHDGVAVQYKEFVVEEEPSEDVSFDIVTGCYANFEDKLETCTVKFHKRVLHCRGSAAT